MPQRSHGRGQVVEFFGFSGSGKSTLCTHVLRDLRSAGIPAESLGFGVHEVSFRRTATVLRQLVLQPGFAWSSAQQIRSSRQRTWRDGLRILRTWLERSHQLQLSARRPGIHLAEEGLFQVLWSMALSSTKADVSEAMLALCSIGPMPSVVIIVDASTQSIVKRLTDRDRGGRVERWLQAEPTFLERAFQRLKDVERLIDRISSDAGLRVLRVRNESSEDLDANRTLIQEFLTGGRVGSAS